MAQTEGAYGVVTGIVIQDSVRRQFQRKNGQQAVTFETTVIQSTPRGTRMLVVTSDERLFSGVDPLQPEAFEAEVLIANGEWGLRAEYLPSDVPIGQAATAASARS